MVTNKCSYTPSIMSVILQTLPYLTTKFYKEEIITPLYSEKAIKVWTIFPKQKQNQKTQTTFILFPLHWGVSYYHSHTLYLEQ